MGNHFWKESFPKSASIVLANWYCEAHFLRINQTLVDRKIGDVMNKTGGGYGKRALARYVAQYTGCVEDMILILKGNIGPFHPVVYMMDELGVTHCRTPSGGDDLDLAKFKGQWSTHLAVGLEDVLTEHVYDLPWWKENATTVRQAGRRYKAVKAVTES